MNKGLVKAIGISNFSITKTESLLQTAKIVPAVNQVECNPYFQQKKLKEYCDRKGTMTPIIALLIVQQIMKLHEGKCHHTEFIIVSYYLP